MGAAIKHPVPDRVKPKSVIFDIRALWRSGLSARVPRCQKLQITASLGLSQDASSCTHMAAVGVKGFVLFKINSSPTAFYIIKPTCISWLVFKVNKCLKNCRKVHTRTFVYVG